MKLAALSVIVCLSLAPAMAANSGPSTGHGQSSRQTHVRPAEAPAILPRVFAGWEISSPVQQGSDPREVDQAQSAVLKEYGFTGYEAATYSQPGRKLTLRVARFQDATGAYGAFTFYRLPGMLVERIGTLGAGDHNRVLFFQQNFLVEARFDRVTEMSAAELRELVAALPALTGPAARLPGLPNYLPREKLVPNSAKYVLGRAAYAALGIAIPENVIDFSRSPEILAGRIAQPEANANAASAEPGAQAAIVLINYPTPQIAIERLPEFEKANPVQDATYVVRRTGPIVKLIYGSISNREADAILGRINYQAEVTWNENTGLSKRDNIGSLVIAALSLAGIIFIFSLGTGAIITFGRVLLSRLLPQRFRKRGEEIIRLNLGK